MLVLSSQQAYAPPQASRAAFSFHGTTDSGFEIDGGGSWGKTSGKIAAGGTFLSSTTVGSWKATDLATAFAPPVSSGPGVVVFTAAFNGADKDTISDKKVVVAAIGTDLDGNVGKNFWVQGFGFGIADARFP